MKRSVYAGLFCVAQATLMLELLLTRVFSITMWYHFAFVAISVAMFGMAIGAVLVYLFPRHLSYQSADKALAASSLAFAVTTVLSFLTQICIPFVNSRSFIGLYLAALIYVIVCVPFCFSGIAVAACLTRYAAAVSRLYAADLIGAACGCLCVVGLLNITDGPSAIFFTAALAACGAAFFARAAQSRKLLKASILVAIIFAGFALANSYCLAQQKPIVRFLWAKLQPDPEPLYQKWNAFSRLTVVGDPAEADYPFGWGLSPTYNTTRELPQLWVSLDAAAQSPITRFSGNYADLEHLKYDLTNAAYTLRPQAKVCVVGTGGGRDVLSALTFGCQSVKAIEVNNAIMETLNGRFGDFSGHLDRDKRVTFVADEARSYLARHPDQFDIIQISMIDTGVSSTRGALALSENSLYTVPAWHLLLDRLNEDGILTCSRWFYRQGYGEMARLTSLARAALIADGAQRPQDHLVVLRRPWVAEQRDDAEGGTARVGTLIVSKKPFSAADLDKLITWANQMKFEVVLSPRGNSDPLLSAIASGDYGNALIAGSHVRLDAPSDDSPFFFYMLTLADTLSSHSIEAIGTHAIYSKAAIILWQLLIVSFGLAACCIGLPLFVRARRPEMRSAGPYLIFFTAIGFGFMLLEVSQMQRLVIFLGHPIYSLSVVLFALLLSSGLGSYVTTRVEPERLTGASRFCLVSLIAYLIAQGLFAPHLLAQLEAATTPVRVATAVALLFPMGLGLGTAFPFGLAFASRGANSSLVPWLWAANGAASVVASVLAVFLAVNFGISTSYWAGTSCYVIALACLVWASKTSQKYAESPRQEIPAQASEA